MSYSRMLVGLGVSPGIAIGPPLVVENRPQPVLRLFLSPDRVEAEVQRLHEAAARAAMALSDLAAQARTTVGHEYASIFEAHRLMAEDPTLLSQVEERIRRESANAEWALQEVIQVMLGQFEGLGDVYLRERRTDLQDVAAQLQRALQGRASPRLGEAPDGAILVADDIPPSQAIQLSSGSVGGFVSEAGGITSHTTIIAKSLGIPAVVGVAQVVPAMERAAMVIVDGFEGHVIVDPEPALVQVYRLRAEEYQQRQRELLATAHLPATTVDGRPVELLANIDLLHEIPAAKAGGAGGVGLFRSEFLFMQASPVLPD